MPAQLARHEELKRVGESPIDLPSLKRFETNGLDYVGNVVLENIPPFKFEAGETLTNVTYLKSSSSCGDGIEP